MLKRLVANFTALFSGEIIARVCHFISVIYLARMLGVAGFGAINFSLALLSYFLMATNLGLGELGVREIARKRDVRETVETIISIRLAASLVSYAALIVIALCLRKMPHTTFLLIAFGFTLLPYSLSVEWVFRGIEKMKYNAYGRIMNALIYVGLVFLIVRKPADILKVAAITITADFIVCVFYYINYSRKFGKVNIHFDLKRWLPLLKVSVQLFLSSALLMVYLNFGTVALGLAKDERAVGIYGAALKLVLFFFALSDTFVAVTFPVISRLYHEASDRLQQFMGYCVKIAVVMGLPVAIGGLVLGPRIIRLVYGASYASAGVLLQIMASFVLINLMSYVISYSLVAFDRQALYLRTLGYAVLLNLVLNITAIPLVGYYAPSVALVITEALVLGLSLFFLKDLIRLAWVKLAARPLAAACLMGLVIAPLAGRLNVLVVIAAGAAAYAAALFLTGAVTKEEIARIRGAFA